MNLLFKSSICTLVTRSILSDRFPKQKEDFSILFLKSATKPCKRCNYPKKKCFYRFPVLNLDWCKKLHFFGPFHVRTLLTGELGTTIGRELKNQLESAYNLYARNKTLFARFAKTVA